MGSWLDRQLLVVTASDQHDSVHVHHYSVQCFSVLLKKEGRACVGVMEMTTRSVTSRTLKSTTVIIVKALIWTSLGAILISTLSHAFHHVSHKETITY